MRKFLKLLRSLSAVTNCMSLVGNGSGPAQGLVPGSIVVYVAVLVVACLSTGCVGTRPPSLLIFPASVKGGNSPVHSFEKVLSEFGEGPIWRDKNLDVYRFLYVPDRAYNDPLVVRLTRSKGQVMVSVKRMDWKSRKVTYDLRRELGRGNAAEIRFASCFGEDLLPPEDPLVAGCRKTGFHLALGSVSLLESFEKGKYHFASRWSLDTIWPRKSVQILAKGVPKTDWDDHFALNSDLVGALRALLAESERGSAIPKWLTVMDELPTRGPTEQDKDQTGTQTD